jgi:hypothetical protein
MDQLHPEMKDINGLCRDQAQIKGQLQPTAGKDKAVDVGNRGFDDGTWHDFPSLKFTKRSFMQPPILGSSACI